MRTLSTKAELFDETRRLRADFLKSSFRTKARDIALSLYDEFIFSGDLVKMLVIEALTDIARLVIQEERARHQARASASAHARGEAEGTPEFPDFDEVCRDCPHNYALPGDRPEDTVYVETFDNDFGLLVAGAAYLEKHAAAEFRNAAALRRLYDLCRRLTGAVGETPREILKRNGYSVV